MTIAWIGWAVCAGLFLLALVATVVTFATHKD